MDMAAVAAPNVVMGMLRINPPMRLDLAGSGLVVDDADHQKEGGFVKGVNQQKGDRSRQCRCGLATQKHDQNAQGHDGGIGQHAFEIRLPDGLNGPQQGRYAADHDQRAHPRLRAAQNRMKPGQQINAGLDHGCRMQKRADWRRRGHGVGQPEMKRKLGGFGEGAD